MSLAAGLVLRMVWAVANTAYRMVTCAQAGHPRQTWAWDRSYRRCGCGRRWPV